MIKVCDDENNTSWHFDGDTLSYTRFSSDMNPIGTISGKYLPNPEELSYRRKQKNPHALSTEASYATKKLWEHWNVYNNNQL